MNGKQPRRLIWDDNPSVDAVKEGVKSSKAEEEPENKTDRVVRVGKPIGEQLAGMGRDNRPITCLRCGPTIRPANQRPTQLVCNILGGLIQEDLTDCMGRR
jgi:hypothetical protein